jgi:hypothetical protein
MRIVPQFVLIVAVQVRAALSRSLERRRSGLAAGCGVGTAVQPSLEVRGGAAVVVAVAVAAAVVVVAAAVAVVPAAVLALSLPQAISRSVNDASRMTMRTFARRTAP